MEQDLNSFYVYVHYRKGTNVPFYVGKGKGNRCSVFSGRTEYWNRVKNKYDVEIDIPFSNLSEEEAFQLEIQTIAEFRYFGYELCNFTNGGEGVSGYVTSEETKLKLSKALKGKKRTPEQIEKSASKRRGLKSSPERIEKMRKSLTGKKQSEETKNKRKETLKSLNFSSDKNIYLFYSKDDIFVGTRKELCKEKGVNIKALRNLFLKTKSRQNSCNGWSVFRIEILPYLNFKEIQK